MQALESYFQLKHPFKFTGKIWDVELGCVGVGWSGIMVGSRKCFIFFDTRQDLYISIPDPGLRRDDG